MYLDVVSALENIVEDLKTLPPASLEMAADFVHRLKRIGDEERQVILACTAGSVLLDTNVVVAHFRSDPDLTARLTSAFRRLSRV